MKVPKQSNISKVKNGPAFGLLDSRIQGTSKQNGRNGKTIVFFGAGGGVGTTTMAGEMSVYLTIAGFKTVALDLNLFNGSLHYKLDVPIDHNSYTISDLIPVINDLDVRTVENALSRSPYGPWLLPAPATCLDADKILASHLTKLASFLSEKFQRVVIDTSATLDACGRALYELADLVILIATPDIFCVGRAYRFLRDIELCFNASPALQIILNRTAGNRDPLPVADIESFLGRRISAVIPEETTICRQLSCQGRPIFNSKTGIGQSVDSAIHQLLTYI